MKKKTQKKQKVENKIEEKIADTTPEQSKASIVDIIVTFEDYKFHTDCYVDVEYQFENQLHFKALVLFLLKDTSEDMKCPHVISMKKFIDERTDVHFKNLGTNVSDEFINNVKDIGLRCESLRDIKTGQFFVLNTGLPEEISVNILTKIQEKMLNQLELDLIKQKNKSALKTRELSFKPWWARIFAKWWF